MIDNNKKLLMMNTLVKLKPTHKRKILSFFTLVQKPCWLVLS